MHVTPSLVRALLEHNERALYRLGDLPPPTADEDLEVNVRRQFRDQLLAEIKNFQAWLERYRQSSTSA